MLPDGCLLIHFGPFRHRLEPPLSELGSVCASDMERRAIFKLIFVTSSWPSLLSFLRGPESSFLLRPLDHRRRVQGRGSEGGQCGEAGAKGAVLTGRVQAGLLFQEDCGKIPGSHHQRDDGRHSLQMSHPSR